MCNNVQSYDLVHNRAHWCETVIISSHVIYRKNLNAVRNNVKRHLIGNKLQDYVYVCLFTKTLKFSVVMHIIMHQHANNAIVVALPLWKKTKLCHIQSLISAEYRPLSQQPCFNISLMKIT